MISSTVLGVAMLFGILASFVLYTLGIINNVFDSNRYVPVQVDWALLVMFIVAITGTIRCFFV